MKKITKQSKWSSIKDLGFFDSNAEKKPAKVRITAFVDSDVLLELKRQGSKKEVFITLSKKGVLVISKTKKRFL